MVDGLEPETKAGAPALTAACVVELLPRSHRAGAYIYTGHHAGAFKGAGGGVALHFQSLETGSAAAVFFNADLRRQRTTKGGKKGELLPRGRFVVARASAFVQFWKRTGLHARGLSEYGEYMGNLKRLLFYAAPDWERPGRLDKDTIKPLAMDAGELLEGLALAHVWPPGGEAVAGLGWAPGKATQAQSEQPELTSYQEASEGEPEPTETPQAPALFAAFVVELTNGSRTTVTGIPRTVEQCLNEVGSRWPGQVVKVRPAGTL